MSVKLPGVYETTQKNGTVTYRSSLTYQSKHISLGSYATKEEAHAAYLLARKLLSDDCLTLTSYSETGSVIPFEKWVILLNFRDNGLYFATPIYLRQKYFEYYLAPHTILRFDRDDLFYYSSHKIMQRGRHFFVADYGMQVNIANRYGIKNYAVENRDYRFINGDPYDFRYENIEIINRYHGVFYKCFKGKMVYETRIHVNGEFIVGRYPTEIEAAVAYNKAASTLLKKGYERNYPVNYLETLYGDEYKTMFKKLTISKTIRELPECTKPHN